jgi:hypothetical protein
MKRPVYACAVVVLLSVPARADIPVPAPPAQFYKSVSAEQVMELLAASGAKEIRRMGMFDGKYAVWAETPVGPIEVEFAQCHEAPNPCGYIIKSRYRLLPLTPVQLNAFNARDGALFFAYQIAGTKDVVLIYPVAVRKGLSREYILSSFGMLNTMNEMFEDFATRNWRIKPEQFRHHVE